MGFWIKIKGRWVCLESLGKISKKKVVKNCKKYSKSDKKFAKMRTFCAKIGKNEHFLSVLV